MSGHGHWSKIVYGRAALPAFYVWNTYISGQCASKRVTQMLQMYLVIFIIHNNALEFFQLQKLGKTFYLLIGLKPFFTLGMKFELQTSGF
jgi:hypothetical protein